MAEKAHRKKTSGRKAQKRKSAEKKKKGITDEARKQNPKAFVFASRGKAKVQLARSADRDQRRMHAPMLDKAADEPPPYTVLVHGPPGVGKSTLIRCLIKHWTRQDVRDIKGPITVVAGKARRLTFVECPQDLSSMIDAAKYADLVLLLIDGAFGFEMETFEFLNMLQVHGFPKVMGVLTHLDGYKDNKALKKTKKALKHRFWAEIYQGAKLFYLSGIRHGKYLKREVLNLARFISVMKFRPLSWRLEHPYLVADRFEDVTNPALVRENPKVDRDVTLYGFVRGTFWKAGTTAHIAGMGDYTVEDITPLSDPCPLPSTIKRRRLNDKDKLIYGPMSDVGGVMLDADAMYIDIPDWKVQYSGAGAAGEELQGEAMIRNLAASRIGIDEQLRASEIQLFADSKPLAATATGEDDEEDDGASSSGDESKDDDSGSQDSEDPESSDEDSEDDDDTRAAANGHGRRAGALPKHQMVRAADGRLRRRAIFGSALESAHGGDSDAEGDGVEFDSDDDNENGGDDNGSVSEDEGDASSSEDDDNDEGLGNAARWKRGMADRATALFSHRAADLQAMIYGQRAIAGDNTSARTPVVNGGGTVVDPNDSDDDDDLFRPKVATGGAGSGGANDASDPDCSRPLFPANELEMWEDDEAVESLRDRFVTGDWAAGEERAAARPGAEDGDENGNDDDDEVYGDFEDVEAGTRFEGSADPATAAAAKAIRLSAEEERRELDAKRATKKAAFDAEYDSGGINAVDGAKKKKGGSSPGEGPEGEEEEESYYDALKRDLAERAQRTSAALSALPEEQRVAMQGHAPGAYVRLRFTGVPYELVKHFDPRSPLLVGGVAGAELGQGYQQVRLKRHRWFPRILKTRDPLIVSVGWRRTQVVPVYALRDNNGRHRALKYTPEHAHCLATWWGPSAPPGTGVLAVQRLDPGSSAAHWRIAATGVVLALDASVRVVKKLKLVGTAAKIHRHTAFVSGMFNSELEAAKFEGAGIRTVSGIRGTIKKAVRAGVQGMRDGTFRATFEDKPLLSDVIFLRAWTAVDVPKFFNPVTNLLEARFLNPARAPKPSKNRRQEEVEEAVQPGTADAGAAAQVPETFKGRFEACPAFRGARPGFVFKLGSRGLGYYEDVGRGGAAGGTLEADGTTPTPDTDGTVTTLRDPAAWVPMRTVADLRRERGEGAPRNSDSLYRDIERTKRVFNPLKVPKALQAALPFKSKPKLEAARKRKSLEQRRAVVLEPGEKRAAALMHQLRAIRNAKAETKRESRKRHLAALTKRREAEEAWRAQYNKEERKKRYVEQGKAQGRAAKKARAGDD